MPMDQRAKFFLLELCAILETADEVLDSTKERIRELADDIETEADQI